VQQFTRHRRAGAMCLVEPSHLHRVSRRPFHSECLPVTGIVFPKGSSWSSWTSDISLFQGDRELLLEIDLLTMHKETGAVRLSSFAPVKDDALVEMPPLAELEGTAGDTEHWLNVWFGSNWTQTAR
jgi:hypothetical protein